MRPRCRFVLGVVVLVLIVGPPARLGAATKIQQCDGPSPPTRSGRARITPGLNGRRSPEQIAVTISLFSCSPAFATRGAETLKTTIRTKDGQTCGL